MKINPSFLLVPVFVATFAGSLLNAGAASLITNGSFENPILAASPGYEFNTNPPGWVGYATSLPDPSWVFETQLRNFGRYAEDGNQFVNLYGSNGGTFTQTLAAPLTIGATYTLTYYIAATDSSPTPVGGSMFASIGDVTLATVSSDGYNASSSSNWRKVEQSFTFIGGVSEVVLHAVTGSGDSILVDNVSLVAAAVPEPSTLATLLLALPGLFVLARMRRRMA